MQHFCYVIFLSFSMSGFNARFNKTFFIFLLFFLYLFSQGSYAQRFVLRVDGLVLNENEKLDGVSITVYRNEEFVKKVVTEGNGRFRFELDYDSDYIIVFSKYGFIDKKVSVNTDGVPPEDQDFGHEYGGWDLSLLKLKNGVDPAFFDKPYVKIFYDPEENKFMHDAGYTEMVKEEFEQAIKDIAKKKKEEVKQVKEDAKAAKKAEAEAAKKQHYSEENKKKDKQEPMVSKTDKNAVQASELKKKPEEYNKARRDTGNYKTKEEFLQALAQLYPSGITEEIYMEGNVKITRRVVVDQNLGNEYKMAEHPWGGRFWFKNGTPINESVWNVESAGKF